MRLAPLEQERADQRELDGRAAAALVVRRQQVAFTTGRQAGTAETSAVPDNTGEGEVVNYFFIVEFVPLLPTSLCIFCLHGLFYKKGVGPPLYICSIILHPLHNLIARYYVSF